MRNEFGRKSEGVINKTGLFSTLSMTHIRLDLTRADLTRADLTRADLTRADLTRADLTRALSRARHACNLYSNLYAVSMESACPLAPIRH